jgi:hypothetical protein
LDRMASGAQGTASSMPSGSRSGQRGTSSGGAQAGSPSPKKRVPRAMQFMTPTPVAIAHDPNVTRDFMPYTKVDMPVVAKYRGGADTTAWQPSEEAVEARTNTLRSEDFVHNPWFIPHGAWSGITCIWLVACQRESGRPPEGVRARAGHSWLPGRVIAGYRYGLQIWWLWLSLALGHLIPGNQ